MTIPKTIPEICPECDERRIYMEELIHKVSKIEAVLESNLNDTHVIDHTYLRTVMEREARKEALHRAIIEKTLVALVWSGITGLSYAVITVLKDHWR